MRNKGTSMTSIVDTYTVIDTETTGFDPKYDEIIEIGSMKVENHKIVDTFQSLIKPKYPIDNFIISKTGITNEMLESAPSIDEILPALIQFVGNDILLGHNINFDINFLYDVLLDKLGHEFDNDFMDLLRFSRRVYPSFENHRLETVGSNLGIDTTGIHRSIKDCEITLQCFIRLIRHMETNNINADDLFPKKRVRKSLDLKKMTSLARQKVAPQSDQIDEEHILYDKNCVFTGKLERLERKDAAQLVLNIGGKCQNGVTRETNFLILGNFDYCSNIKGNKSSKLKKAEDLILKGQDLQILSENVFYDLFENTEVQYS